MELEPGETVGRLIEKLGIPPRTVKTVFVNGVIRGDDQPLRDGEEVGIFPPIAGGSGAMRFTR